MQALRIDPELRTVTLVDAEAEDMPHLLGTVRIDAVDLDEHHTVLIGDDLRYADHPTRFRLADGPKLRPFFGPALVVGLVNGNWAHVTLDAAALLPRIIWERWDEAAMTFIEEIIAPARRMR